MSEDWRVWCDSSSEWSAGAVHPSTALPLDAAGRSQFPSELATFGLTRPVSLLCSVLDHLTACAYATARTPRLGR